MKTALPLVAVATLRRRRDFCSTGHQATGRRWGVVRVLLVEDEARLADKVCRL
jgi:hypothetical protein